MRSRKLQHPIQLIGVGLEGPEGLCREMLERVREADLLVGGEKILKLFKGFSGQRLAIKGHLDGLAKKIRQFLKKEKRVIVLTSGDPNFFGIARFLLKSFHPEEVEIHPGLSSMQLAFARIRTPWDDAVFVSAHGRELASVIDRVRRHSKIAILTDPKNHPSRIAKGLLGAGVAENAGAFVCSRLGGPDEKVWEGRLASLPGKRFPDLNVMIVLHETEREEGLGIPDQEFAHERGMITCSEVRAVTLSKLRIGSGDLLWDIGAGSGSVSVEAVHLAPKVTAYAVEKSRKRISGLKQNIKRFGSGNIHPVMGEAPSILKGLPDPDRIFIGGSGSNLASILKASARRLRKGGRIVVNAVTLETLQQTREFFIKQEFAYQVVSVQIGRGHDLKGKVMLQAENPVFIVSAEKRT